MHTLLICVSVFAESNYLYGLGDIRHYLLYVKSLNNILMKPTDVGISHLFLIVKGKFAV